jgi:hypothetical protein
MSQQSRPVVVVASGGLPVVNVGATPPFGALPATVVTQFGIAITLVAALGIPMSLWKTDGTAYP